MTQRLQIPLMPQQQCQHRLNIDNNDATVNKPDDVPLVDCSNIDKATNNNGRRRYCSMKCKARRALDEKSA